MPLVVHQFALRNLPLRLASKAIGMGSSLHEIAERLEVWHIDGESRGEADANGLRESGAGAKELNGALDKIYSLIQA